MCPALCRFVTLERPGPGLMKAQPKIAHDLSLEELSLVTGIADLAVLSFVWMVDLFRLLG